ILDEFMQDYMNYLQVQQELQQISKRLIGICSKQKMRIASLEKLLLPRVKHTESSHPMLQERDSRDHLPLREDYPADQPVSLPALESRRDEADEDTTTSKEDMPRPATENTGLPALYFTCFGHFTVKRLEQTLPLCPNRNGQAILRYLVAQSHH